MPQAKYRRRSQRNRRREGSAKYVAPAALDPTQFNTITVSGAGTAAANGVYTWDSIGTRWAKSLVEQIIATGANYELQDGGGTLYTQPIAAPLPYETGWIIDTGTAPAPTISYTG